MKFLDGTKADRKSGGSRGMTKGRVVTFVRSRQIGWTERNSTTLRSGRDDNFV